MYYVFAEKDFNDKEQEMIKMSLVMVASKVVADLLATVCFVFTKNEKSEATRKELDKINCIITPIVTEIQRMDCQDDIRILANNLTQRVITLDD